jgi:hypothetical protein
MIPMILNRVALRYFTLLTALSLLFTSASSIVLAGADLRIRTVHRYTGSPIPMNLRIAENILYLQNNRRRVEERRQQVNPLWPDGPQVTFYEPHTALLESCNGDVKSAVVLNLDDNTYAPKQMSRKLTAEEIKNLDDHAPNGPAPTRPTVLHEITTKDTGGRKQSFGYSARHVITTFKSTPLEGTASMQSESITDGWYIDLDTRISCDISPTTPREGTTYSVVQISEGVLTPGQVSGPMSVSEPSVVQTTYVGKPETGFPIWIRTTMRRPVLVPGAKSQQVNITQSEVTELSAKALDPSLFEVPKDFRSVPRILPVPRVAFWAGWLAWVHYYWVRFKRRI